MERLEACPGSAALSEGLPDKSSPWALEGTEAHEVLEAVVLNARDLKPIPPEIRRRPQAMFSYAESACNFLIGLSIETKAVLSVETKVDLDFIHPDAGGTLDYSVPELFGTLHIIDYKYGAGHAVSSVDNLQLATYGVGEAEKYHWNFKRIRQWIIQPRVRGYDGPTFWELPTIEYKNRFVPRLRRIVERAETETDVYEEGPHCHWCKAKKICPLKVEGRIEKAKQIFKPVGGEDGSEKKSEADWRKESRARR